MNIYEKSIEVNKKLITVLDELLANAKWDASLFLRATGKQVQELRDKAEQLLIEATGSAAHVKNAGANVKAGCCKVFISVYQADGNNLQQWHRTLKSINTYSIGRPVYSKEENVRAMIRSKIDKQREGYVTVLIKEQDITSVGREITDRFGNELLTLKMGAVHPENILEFFHGDKIYNYSDEGLVLKRDAS